jgi:hypothetical protein
MAIDKNELNNPPPTTAPTPTAAAPKPSAKDSFNDALDNPFDNFKFDQGEKKDRQEKQDGMQELMEILKEIATDFHNAAMNLGGKIYNHFNSPENTAGKDATTNEQENPVKMEIAADTKDTKLATVNGMDDSISNPAGKMTPTPEPDKKLDNVEPAKIEGLGL